MNLSKLLLTSLAALSLTTLVVQAANPAEKLAEQSAQQWLFLIDHGDYFKSWDSAAADFKDHITKASWYKDCKAARESVGALVSRKFRSATNATHLPHAPDGQYVVIQYDTKFKNKTDAIETITPVLDHGTWKVAGYLIK